RLGAGIEWVLRHNLANGHTCLPSTKLLAVADRLLGVGQDALLVALEELLEQKRVIKEDLGEEMIFLPDMYAAESYIANRLSLIMQRADKKDILTETELYTLEKQSGMQYSKGQKEAVRMAVESGLLILTGGPGTGKTTVIKAIISALESRNMKIELAAPTGRAAKRMEELCGHNARTIHRLLEVEFGEEERTIFRRNERDMLDCDAVIIDEVSMVDSTLFCALLKAIPMGCKIILVGDSDQLPSVGAGNVLADLIGSGMLPCVALKEVFRQAAESLIVRNAHAIIGGNTPAYNEKGGDFFLVKAANPVVAARTVRDLVATRLPEAYGFAADDIQVLCPSRLNENGTLRLNNIIQQQLNPPKEGEPEIRMKDFILRVGDRVMQVKNNYDICWVKDDGEEGQGIFNGDIGCIESIDPSGGTARIRFADCTAEYFGDEIAQLEPAWAITIHKSQGSEYECVILPLIDAPQKLRYRNLLYTAVTRAKSLICVVGSEQVIESMIANDRKTLRYTGLKEMVRKIEGR
ncbi:MAG: AAA family ATPase, partial [Clostridia bacterium]|nr:AAA family ATPase [Clostridia bacterium]